MAQTTPSEVAGAEGGAPFAVLVIDGNEEHQILSVAALTRKGWVVRTATTGKQGLQLATAQHFDAIVVGSKMRDSTGVEVVRLLSSRIPDVPKIFVVPPEGEEAALQALQSGALSYIVKTPRYTELMPAIVEEHIGESRNRRRLAETEKTQAKAVTDRKTVEERLSQSETRLRMILEQAPVLLWSTDKDLRVTSALGAGLRALDFRSRERGLTLYEYFNVPHDDIEPIVSHRRALAGESVATQIEWQGRTYDVHVDPLRTADGAIIGTIGVALDVSERAQNQESLRRSEERFHLLGRATSDVVWDWDLQTDGMWMNENAAKVFGYDAEEVEPTGAWWEERLHPGDREKIVKNIEELIRSGGTAITSEYRFRRKDGMYATVVDRGYVLHDPEGHPLRMIGSAMDVTRLRKAEAIQSAVYRISEATNSAKNLPELYAQIHRVIGGLMPATNFYIALSDEKAGTLEFPYFVDEEESPPPPQKLGRGLTEYVLRTGRALLASPEVFDALVGRGDVVTVGPRSVDWVGAPLVSQGKTIGVIVVQSYTPGVRFADEDKAVLNFVSEQVAMAIDRKRTQEALLRTGSELQAIFRAVPDLCFRLAADGTILGYYAGRSSDLYVPPEAFLGRRIQDVLPPDVGGPFARSTERVIQTQSLATMEYRLKVPSGTKEFEARILPLMTDQVVVVVRDITEKKALERRLVESERLATMGQLAGFIAHELNTPLTNIALLTSAVSHHVKDEAAREKLEKINVERRRAADIIQQLLSLSKNRPVTAIETDLRSVVQTAADHAKRYRKQGVALDVEVGESPMPVVVDPLQIQEVMMHLVKNAFEATSRGNVRIRIEDRGEFHAIVVSDTGSGIPEDVLSHLFQPFYTTKASSGGIGLGLLQSKHIATGHGGTIEVTSEPGKGSTFTVFLPRRQSHEDLSRR